MKRKNKIIKRLARAKETLTKTNLNDILHHNNCIISLSEDEEITDFHINDDESIDINIHDIDDEDDYNDWTLKLPEDEQALYNEIIKNYKLYDDPIDDDPKRYTFYELCSDKSVPAYITDNALQEIANKFYFEFANELGAYASKWNIKFDKNGHIVEE